MITIHRSNNQTDGIEFDCQVCKGETDLHISEEDIAVYDQSNQKNVSVTVHADSNGAANVLVRFYGIDSSNQLLFTQDTTITAIGAYSDADTSIVRDLTGVYFLNIQIDPDNAIAEPKSNNFVKVRPDDVSKPKVALKIFTGLPED